MKSRRGQEWANFLNPNYFPFPGNFRKHAFFGNHFWANPIPRITLNCQTHISLLLLVSAGKSAVAEVQISEPELFKAGAAVCRGPGTVIVQPDAADGLGIWMMC